MIRAKTILPICKYPTTIVLVDDDEGLLRTLVNNLKNEYLIKGFINPYEAQNYLNAHCGKDIIKENYVNILPPNSSEEVMVSINYANLSAEVNNPEKLNTISALIIDYDMPSIDGLEICKSLTNYNLTKILLSGNIKNQDVINAFNQGIIDGYVDKYNLNLTAAISEVIESAEEYYFNKLSAFCSHAILLDKSKTSFLGTPQYIAFFKRLIKEYQIVEYYLIDSIGSYLLKTKNGNLMNLYISDEEGFRAMLEILPEETATLLISDILAKKKMFCNLEIKTISTPNIEQHVHLAHNVPGIEGLYYSLVSIDSVLL